MDDIEIEEIGEAGVGLSLNYENQVVYINNLPIYSEAAIDMVKRMVPQEVEMLINSLLVATAKVAKGATTAEIVMKEFREKIQRETRTEFEGFKDVVKMDMREFQQELTQGIEDAIKQISEGQEGSNAEFLKKINGDSETIKKLIEEKIGEKLQKISEKIAVSKKEQEIFEKTPLGGREFEGEIYKECRKHLEKTEDIVDFVAKHDGVLKRKTGDIVIHHSMGNGLKPTTVIECKNQNQSGNAKVSKILSEIDTAIANREADSCLYLVKSLDQLPESFKPFKFGDRYIIASHGLGLPILLSLSKLVGALNCRIVKEEDDGMDIEGARNEIQRITTELNKLSEIQNKALLIIQHGGAIGDMASELKRIIERSVSNACEKLTN